MNNYRKNNYIKPLVKPSQKPAHVPQKIAVLDFVVDNVKPICIILALLLIGYLTK